MDLQVGWRFTKGQHVSEIQETTFSERGATGGYAKCPRSILLLRGSAFIFLNSEMCHFFSHILLRDMYKKCNESFMDSVRNFKWTEENLKCHSHYKDGLYAS